MPKLKCLRCQSELATLESQNEAIKTRVCTECGLIENSFCQEPLAVLLEHAERKKDGKA